MPDYKNGKIYQIVCNITGETYIGSTCKSLEDRLIQHKSDGLNILGNRGNVSTSKQIIERRDYYIELLEMYPCNTAYELERKEGEYQRTIKCINKVIAGRTRKEWFEDNKQHRINYSKTYNIENAEAIKKYKTAETTCECGTIVHRTCLSSHLRSQKHKDLMNNIDLTLGKFICECGSAISKRVLAKHRRTKKHIDLMNKITSPSNYLLDEEKVL